MGSKGNALMATTLLDLDGVVNNWVTPFNAFICAKRGFRLTDWSDWYHYRTYGLTDEDFLSDLHEFAKMGLFTHGEPFPGVVEPLQLLHAEGHTIHVVTDRPDYIQDETADWLQRHKIPFDTLEVSRDKTIFMKHGPGPYYGLDDKVQNVDALTEARVRAFLLRWPWNAHSFVNTVQEYVDIVLDEQTTP